MKSMRLAILSVGSVLAISGCAGESTKSLPTGVETSGLMADLVDTKVACFNEIVRGVFVKELKKMEGNNLILPSLKVESLQYSGDTLKQNTVIVSISNSAQKNFSQYSVSIYNHRQCDRLAIVEINPTPFSR